MSASDSRLVWRPAARVPYGDSRPTHDRRSNRRSLLAEVPVSTLMPPSRRTSAAQPPPSASFPLKPQRLVWFTPLLTAVVWPGGVGALFAPRSLVARTPTSTMPYRSIADCARQGPHAMSNAVRAQEWRTVSPCWNAFLTRRYVQWMNDPPNGII